MSDSVVKIYTDGSCRPKSRGIGGYGVVLLIPGTDQRTFGRYEFSTTNNRMEVKAAWAGIRKIKEPSIIEVYSDSEYLVKTMMAGWKRKANTDLWNMLQVEIDRHLKVTFHWVKGHSGDEYNETANTIATQQSERGIAIWLAKQSSEQSD